MAIFQLIYKIIYNGHSNYILRNFNFSIKSVLPRSIKIPPSGILRLITESGIIKISTNQTSYLTQLLFWKGYKAFEYSEIFEKLSKKIDIFFDIGSNIGYYSLLAVKSNPKLYAYAFEPAIGPNYFLNENIRLNKYENQIKAFKLALGNTVGEIDFYEVESLKYTYLKHNLAGEGNAGTKKTSRNFKKNTVISTTLSNFVESEKIHQIDVIKIDTEGTEIDILRSGRNIIMKFQPIIICETLFNTIENDLDTFFKELDYEFYNHTPKGIKKVETIKRSSDNSIRNCFFVPKSKVDLISEFIVE